MLISRLLSTSSTSSTSKLMALQPRVSIAATQSIRGYTATTGANDTSSQTLRVSSIGGELTSAHEHSADDGLEAFAFSEDVMMDRHYEKAIAHDAARAATFGEVRVLPAAAKYHNINEMHGD
ncbi:hypothetical protein GQ54DRAFT_299074 [Martensiomyces pterosporus]|nr:hypothetical protein GQ54DRAFT_299074 [Martensiomyces pterosporus]